MASPSPFFGLGEFDQGSNPGATALNLNWTTIDFLLAKALRFRFSWSGTLQLGQGSLIPEELLPKTVSLVVKILRVRLKTPATGQDAKFTFYKNGVSIGVVTVAAGTNYGQLILMSAVTFTDADAATMDITQVGTIIAGATATGYMEAA